MTKKILPFIVIIGLISCNTNTVTVDYFGESEPETTPVIFGEDVISLKGRFEHGISFTPDTRELLFGILNEDDFSGDIYYSKKVNDEWSMPESFKPLENESVYLPYFSPNGKSLVFTQSKWDTAFHYKDIWIIEKNNKTWNNPKKMKVPSNALSSVSNACMTLEGTIYFSSNINCIGIENCQTADLFYSKLINNQYQSAKGISVLITPNDEESVFVSSKDEYLIFSRYATNRNGPDLFISYRDFNNNWLEPQILDSTINSKDWDRRPFVSFDNKFLFFTRLQKGENGITESDLYWVKTSKLFKPFVYKPINDTLIIKDSEYKYQISENTFRDINDEKFAYELIALNLKNHSWLDLDKEKLILSGNPSEYGKFDYVIRAIDKDGNFVDEKIMIEVE